ncbi:hypothetical protein H5J25_17655 [Sphingomonas aliaeris]|uniref:Tox-REase-5 domain-containing protein n=1 Tax=Sphingomonas aliaeris TaxID=2759526 RepID=A0A974NUG3_9SPHN|nr:hypothetical protein [Sphingomonas aliaeris]QQV77135.1 hypothetical protein H5J25_17655 [Sphingomonas aliaeris]
MNLSDTERRQGFSTWLRTGRLPSVRNADGHELKFNPWHDTEDGRFTFVGSGRRYGNAGGTMTVARARNIPRNVENSGATRKPRGGSSALANASPTRPRTVVSPKLNDQAAIRNRTRTNTLSLNDTKNPVVEGVIGFGEEIYSTGKGAVSGLYSALTTNPVTTARNLGDRLAHAVDDALVAEDTPASVQISRAAKIAREASARDIGRAAGSVVGNVALAAAPIPALSRISVARAIRKARPRTTYLPPEIGWANENLKSRELWKIYNDSATGARPGKAPTLMRTLPDGSKRPVKFDGIDGDYLIDRKWTVVNRPRARAQVLRQSQALAQNRQIGLWEVPTALQKEKALKLLKEMNVKNIKVRIVKP